MENWDEVWRRNQFLCAGLAARYPGSKILFVGLPRDISNDLRHGRLTALAAADEAVPGLPGITLTRPIKLLPNTLGWGRRVNETLFRASVRRSAQRLGMQSPVLWLNPHSAVHMAGQMGEAAVIYDITDDWTTLTQSPALARLTAEQDADLCRRADAVIVCSERLFEMKRGLAQNLHLIPNGVEADHYKNVLDGTGPLPAPADGWAKPVLGYTGTIHPDRVDVPLVESLARRFPQGTVALVGPNLLTGEDRQRLAACPNVVLTGPVPYARVPEIMRAFDVCITPHRMTAFTESLNPIKLWEYLAAGKPIVATDVAGFRDYPQFVRLASDAGNFAKAAEEALGEDHAIGEARRTVARRHSWNARLDQVEKVFAESTQAPIPPQAATLPKGEDKEAGSVSGVIISYNTRQMTLDCLQTLFADLKPIAADVWVVDNASQDGSAEAIRAAFPQVKLIENPKNAGFGAANNLALQSAQGEFLLLLNSDAFVQPGAVAALTAYLKAHPAAGIIGPRLLNADGSLQRSCYRFPSPGRAWLENLGLSSLLARHPVFGDYSRWAHDTDRSVEWIIGACLLVRREAYAQAGGFDEAFFMYQEETDWQRRVHNRGWDIAFTPTASVTHLGGASGTSEQAKINAHFFDSLDYYIRKHHGLAGLISLRLAMIVGSAARTLAWGGIAAAFPRRRTAAQAKTRLQAWLCVRQATRWRRAGKGASA